MKVTAYASLMFVICLNLSLFFLNETQVLPAEGISPFEQPENMLGYLVQFDLSTGTLMMAGITLGIGFILSKITGNLIFGGTVAIILFAFDLLFPVVRWVLFGFPIFLGQIGLHIALITIIEVLFAVVWFWFILGFIGQRSTWEQ